MGRATLTGVLTMERGLLDLGRTGAFQKRDTTQGRVREKLIL